MIPQSNPHASYLTYKDEIDAAVQRVLNSGWYILGKEVAAFEEEFSAYLGVPHTVGVANGTDAIELALRASGVTHGDVVATVSHTAVATVSAISRIGAVPVFIDIGDDFLMSAACLAETLESKCLTKPKAVIVVHLYGQVADMPAILGLAEQHGMVVIEDCAQAHGATLHGRMAGSWGDVACFSFYPTKNLGALGDAGALITRNEALANRTRALRQYGWHKRYISDEQGLNSRLDELQAAVLRVKLRGLKADNRKRSDVAACYRERLKDAPLNLPLVKAGCEHVYHQFVIQSHRRDFLSDKLKAAGVSTAIHYPLAVHQQTAYSAPLYCPLELPVTEKTVTRILSLPMFPEMSVQNAEYVADSVLFALNDLG